jgi:hypothetical protein
MRNAARPLLSTVVYPVLLAVMIGAAWLDGVYARALRGTLRDEALHEVFSTVSDALLLPGALAVLAGAAACVFTSGRARWLCIGSLGVLWLELLLPMLAGAIPGATRWLEGYGLLLRLAVLLGALACAVLALRESAK